MKRIIAIALFAASSLSAAGNLSAQDHMVTRFAKCVTSPDQ